MDENVIKRAQIRRTIFIDEVKKYRTEDGGKGLYVLMFEECYAELLARLKYAELRDRFTANIDSIHNGYFSQDKKGNYKNTKGDTLDDYDTYSMIMKDKEWLLSFDCPLRFIFSHSALKEGWDNPNVFQVCTLIDQKFTFTCRQKVGRGLRLCVNQDGERIEDKNINILHVMANESFAEFADTLQKEIENDTGVKFGVLEISLFSGMVYEEEVSHEHTIDHKEAQELVSYWTESGTLDKWMYDPEMVAAEKKITAQLESGEISLPPNPATEVMRQIKQGATPEQAAIAIVGITSTVTEKVERTVTYDEAAELLEHFKAKGYTDRNGKIKDTMKAALNAGTLDLPKKFEAARQRFETIISHADQKPPLRDASRDVTVKLNKQVMLSPEFIELWNKIKQKTVYRVTVDTAELIRRCVKALADMPTIPKMQIISQTADIHVDKPGVSYTEREYRARDIQNDYAALPNVLTLVGEACLVKRSTVKAIIEQSGRLSDFINNPQVFIERLTDIINNNRHELAIDGIRYIKLDGEEYYVQEIFDSTELIANLDRNAVAVKHSVYDYVIYDSSSIEKPFSLALDNDPDVRMFFKLPDRFKIDTPIGTYNPDWAVYLTRKGEEKLYFVLETKGSIDYFDLRTKEQLKIHCGKQHFKALNAAYFEFDVRAVDTFFKGETCYG